MPTPFVLKAVIVPKSQMKAFGFDFENYQFKVDVITPTHTFKDFKKLNNYVFGFNEPKDAVLIIDLLQNPEIKIVLINHGLCAN
jgi:hypothetical protein